MKVQEFLHFRGKTQTQVADALGISNGHFSEMCRGIKGFPLDKVLPLAEMMNLAAVDVVSAFVTVRETYERERNSER
jgi:transcriptional regulator with XRE-family HTH domain